MSAESKVAAPVGGVLAEVLAVLAKATEREWFVGETLRTGSLAVVGDGDSVVCEFHDRFGGAEEDAAAIVAAVNYLRSHGEAIGELIAAARDLRRTKPTYSIAYGRAEARLDAALAKVASNGASA